MQLSGLGEVLEQSAERLRRTLLTVSMLAERSHSDRVQLLSDAYRMQLEGVSETLQKIITRQSRRALSRRFGLPTMPLACEQLPLQADSQTLTLWLITQLNGEAAVYQALADNARLGPARSAIDELAALFPAQSRRIALEAHRFSDL